MAKYSNSPIGEFLEMPTGEFGCWIKIMNEEIELEKDATKKSTQKNSRLAGGSMESWKIAGGLLRRDGGCVVIATNEIVDSFKKRRD